MKRPGLPDTLQKWFADNPGKELTFAEIEQLFGARQRNAQRAVQMLVQDGLLESKHIVRVRRV